MILNIIIDIFVNGQCRFDYKEITILLETSCEEIKVAPHLSFELFIEDLPGSVPITFNYTKDGIQIYQNQRIGNWMITFNGQETIPAILKNYLK